MNQQGINNTQVINSILYYADLICQKIDLQTEYFLKRIEALQKHDPEKALFIEKMLIEPIDVQLRFLAEKLEKICEKGK